MRHLRALHSDVDRFLIALVVAFVLHGLLFLVIPHLDTDREVAFDAPLYVALDPLPLSDGEIEPAPSPPVPERATPEEPVIHAEQSAAAARAANAAEPGAESSPTRSAETSSAAARGEPTFTPPPPPALPRTRVASDLRGDFASSAPASDAFLEEQLQALYDWQETYRRDFEAWEAEQAARAPEDGRTAVQPAIDGALERELDRLVDAIRLASPNVVDAVAVGNGYPSADPDTDSPQDGGIAIGEGDGRRIRIAGEPVVLDDVALSAGFPAEYPVSVRFRVNAAGVVVSATVFPPTPAADLNAAIVAAVRTWVFQPAAADSPTVDGAVTIIVETRAGR